MDRRTIHDPAEDTWLIHSTSIAFFLELERQKEVDFCLLKGS
jgi:hypothetical protein